MQITNFWRDIGDFWCSKRSSQVHFQNSLWAWYLFRSCIVWIVYQVWEHWQWSTGFWRDTKQMWFHVSEFYAVLICTRWPELRCYQSVLVEWGKLFWLLIISHLLVQALCSGLVLNENVFVSNSLLDVYAKYGRM